MASSGRLVRCAECNGSGSKPFETICEVCSGKSTIKCEKCRNGNVSCKVCHGTGKEKYFAFIHFTCSACEGKGTVKCPTCSGTLKINCTNCNGIGKIRQSNRCPTCNGSGQVEDAEFRDWINDLNGFSVDRLKDERNRRQYKISDSRSKIRQFQAEIRQGWDDWETSPGSSNNCRHGWTPSEWGINQDISNLERTILELEEEIDFIQEVLDRKLR